MSVTADVCYLLMGSVDVNWQVYMSSPKVSFFDIVDVVESALDGWINRYELTNMFQCPITIRKTPGNRIKIDHVSGQSFELRLSEDE